MLTAEGKKFTLKRLLGRVIAVFDWEIGEHLGNAVKFLRDLKSTRIDVKMPAQMNELDCYKTHFLNRQTEAIEYVANNRTRLTEKSKLNTIKRMYRVFDRYLEMKWHAEECIDAKLRETETKVQMELAKELAKIKDLLPRNQQQAGIKNKLEETHNITHWQELKNKVQKIDDTKLREELKMEKKKLENSINQTEKALKEKIEKNIPDIFTLNAEMRELVKGKNLGHFLNFFIDFELIIMMPTFGINLGINLSNSEIV
jgi:hypothetical protein